MPECGRGQSNCRGSSFNKKRKKKKCKLINIGTWNVRTLTCIGRLYLLLQELTECNMNITGLCETRWSGEGHFSSGERTIIHSGKEKGDESGVAIVLDKTHAGCMKSYNPVSDRILTVKLNTKPVALNIIQVMQHLQALKKKPNNFILTYKPSKTRCPKEKFASSWVTLTQKLVKDLNMKAE
ncbi:endonuclease-reverse transcriptase [Elysia marginata]|uniref:Endonuclease-reverse transcriptase n=1 Tax=Elysia marginata TaxID=1093978 RepID=A0AAV4H4K4_9GAST|nr:endonuclease-reverse transcriptase [Elysia marginata]